MPRPRWVPTGDVAWSVTLLALAVGAYFETGRLAEFQAHDPLGPRFFPQMSAVLLGVAAVAVLVGPLLPRREPIHRRPRPATSPLPWSWIPAPETQRVFGMIAITSIYLVLLPMIGYIPATALAMAGVLALLGNRRPRSLLVGPIVTSVLVYFIFTNFLSVRLP